MAVFRAVKGWIRFVCDGVSDVIGTVRTRAARCISVFVEAARTLWTGPDESRDVPGPLAVRVGNPDQDQPVVVAPVIVRPTQVVGPPVPVRVAGPVTVVPGLVPVPARIVPVVAVPVVVGPLVIPGPAQVPTVPGPALEPELGSVRDPVRVTEEDILAGEISRTVVRNGCVSTREGPVSFSRRGRLRVPTTFHGEVVRH